MSNIPAWMRDECHDKYGSDEHQQILLSEVARPYDVQLIMPDKKEAVAAAESTLFNFLFDKTILTTGGIGKLNALLSGGAKRRDEREEPSDLRALSLMQKELTEAYVQSGIASGEEAARLLVRQFTLACKEVLNDAFDLGKGKK